MGFELEAHTDQRENYVIYIYILYSWLWYNIMSSQSAKISRLIAHDAIHHS